MKIARWVGVAGEAGDSGPLTHGFVEDDRVIPFGDGLTVAEVLARGLPGLAAVRAGADEAAAVPLAEVTLRAPLDPASVRDFVAFEEHVEGVSAGVEGRSFVAPEWYEAPTFYFTNPHTISGPLDLLRPPVTERLDFELEVALVVGGVDGSDGANLDVGSAAAHIFGYTIMNDWSARDLQGREMKVRLGPAKGKDFGMTLGPWIVTADELAGYEDAEGFLAVRAEVYVNDELIGHDLVSNAGWPFPEFVVYASRNSRVVPGDVLGSGTVGNGGCLAELWGRNGSLTPPPLREGDEVRMVVEGIGELVNRVGAPVAAPPVPAARVRPRIRHRA
ncbi:fumarylacetoacetate hydrolase family protein [Herbiconiux sp. UC225_62]|uniref:fumarylacetoacetate hydrolase family protein n=1 Tax=Herbiconiux sp. UC225_62 TaxID=3350168 RepID=UPI0036D3D258